VIELDEFESEVASAEAEAEAEIGTASSLQVLPITRLVPRP
jgi:hypothetical protein